MWPYHPELLEQPVPRYTSFPTAAEFEAIDAGDYSTAIESTSGDVSLYVHIPFCEKICHYCGCNTGAAGRRHRLESYLEALHREIETVSRLLPSNSQVRRIAFGGGSPNALAPTDFVRLVDDLIIRFGISDPVFSIELDPRTMSREWAEVIRALEIDRASLGVQTFAPHCQEAIGRVQSETLIAETTDLLRNAGVTSLNFDLMYGLPQQSNDDLSESLQRAVAFGADRIALFGYAHMPNLVPRQRAVDARFMPDRAARFEMAQIGFTYLCSNGFRAIGFDHFARSEDDPLAIAAQAGTLRRNFQGFTDDNARALIGLGASAISSFETLLAQNEKNSGRYRMLASDGRLATVRGRSRSTDDRTRGQVIEQLLCSGKAQISSETEAQVMPFLMPFLERGLACCEEGAISITPHGLPYSRAIAALFDPYLDHPPGRFSSAV
uniref:oxygen-independent coproporphyrinogen III oxidase n=1 Tax=Parerythrobacter lutipelagi TaxID=1964208 RepID=UPI0010F9B50C|nr:oxygen-independent coproporphyrinogen III oxidase [Parerythrobacter lutipelagi]